MSSYRPRPPRGDIRVRIAEAGGRVREGTPVTTLLDDHAIPHRRLATCIVGAGRWRWICATGRSHSD